jgi:hypothetical protein
VFVLKLVIVPFFIAVVTLAGRRWGAGIGGLLGGLPVVAGPIVVFVALEQGPEFGALAANAAIFAIAGLLTFGVVYSWACSRWPWQLALTCGLAAWMLVTAGLAALPSYPLLAAAVALVSLVVAPRLLPSGGASFAPRGELNDLPHRMIAGALLTLGVTEAAALLGGVWSGFLAAFPIVGMILAVFTHRNQGKQQVAHLYRGMVQGLYSFAIFFLLLALLWPNVEFWSACALAIGAGVVVQAVIQWYIKGKPGLPDPD